MEPFADIRRDYGELSLDEALLADDPIVQFTTWFNALLDQKIPDPTAMVLSTVDAKGNPDSRVVLLKGLDEGDFLFYTNYQSTKAKQIQKNAHVALNFYWPHVARQVRIKGIAKPITDQQSDAYFATRPFKSQASACISPQSEVIKDRVYLERAFNEFIEKNNENIPRPAHWGGYRVVPEEIEFWQGRDNRLHDRIRYQQHKKIWHHQRLAP